ncbi:hypothetical protein [Actinomadura hibisca]|uniref:hypothetical protein n=1 Tax=Actinomadura hibisca TaxID=68565 RepID=UPI0008329477|nr:hypothetical protein [Actinomadura hibisca]
MAPKETAYDVSEMRNIARAMRQELDALMAIPKDVGGRSTAGTIGGWDVATALGTSVDDAHQNMVDCLITFLGSYEVLVQALNTATRNYSFNEAGARQRHEEVGRGLVPEPTRESQN